MTKNNSKNKKNDSGVSASTVAAIGAGVVALAAGAYFFFGPEGKKNRNKLRGWMIKMKGEIVEKLEGTKELSEVVYYRIVDTVAKKYFKEGEAEVKAFAEALKRQWKGIQRSAAKHNGTTAKKSSAKKSSKKSGAAKSSNK